MPAAVAIPAVLGAIGVGGSIFSGIKSANAAKDATAIQSEAAAKAGQQVTDTAKAVNPLITEAAAKAGSDVTNTAGLAGAGVASATDRANALLDPYRTAGDEASGTLQNGLVPGGDFNRNPTAADIQLDPGFANRLHFADVGVERSAAARGGAASGSALMDLSRFNQNEASQEYEKAFQRFRQSTQDRFSNLNTVAARGSTDAATEGANLIGSGKYSGDKIFDAAEYQGDKNYNATVKTGDNTFDASKLSADYLTQEANAKAAGKVGAANALTGAVSSGLGALTNAGTLYNSLKNPQYYKPGNMNTSGGPG